MLYLIYKIAITKKRTVKEGVHLSIEGISNFRILTINQYPKLIILIPQLKYLVTLINFIKPISNFLKKVK